MAPGIDPRVDIVFKKLFATPAWSELTISLINAVLQQAEGHQVVALDILDPYSEKDSPDDKLTILDIKARDQQGRLFNVEMQMNLIPALPERLIYYWAQLYSHQLVVGEEYTQLCPTISICFLNQVLYADAPDTQSVFLMLERDRHTVLTQDFQLHLLELPKFRRELGLLHEPLDYWLYFFQNGEQLDADSLPGPLTRPEICQAMEVLKVFSQSDVERDRYENRMKALRDQRTFIRARDEAFNERDQAFQRLREFEQERAQERQQVEQERQQAEQERQQAEQELKQRLARQIQLCQRLLSQPAMDTDKLLANSTDELRAWADQLEQKLSAE